MPAQFSRKQRLSLPAVFVALVASLILLAPALDITAQVIRSNPSPTPTTEFDPGLVARPTESPTEPPTEVPERVSPTEVPTQPAEVPATGTIAITIGACDDVTFDPDTARGLEAFQEACQSPDGEAEFIVSDGAGFAATAWTALGTVTFEVPVAPISMVESIPSGWGVPTVFCWSNLLPSPSDTPFVGNGPIWDVQAGEAIECWWFNISPAATQSHTIQVAKHECPPETDMASDYWTLATTCVERVAGVDFQLITEAETLDGTTDAIGAIAWTDVALGASGTIQIDEAIPGGFGEPAVWCVSFPEAAADPEDFEFFPVTSTDGTVSVEPDPSSPFIFSCSYFNQAITGGSGDLAAPSSVEGGDGNTLILNKYRCPLGAPYEDFGSDIFDYCTEPHADMAFTLSHDDLSDPQSTDEDGTIIWTGLPAGEFIIAEQLIAGYEDVIVYCEWTEVPPDVVVQVGRIGLPAPGGQFLIDISATGTTVECGVFNLPRYQSRIVLNKQICPSGVDLALTDENPIDDIIDACPVEGNGIEFTLDNAHGTSTRTIENGATMWVTVPHGPFTLAEEIPAGYVAPVWYCDTVALDEDGNLVEFHAWELTLAPGGVLSASIDAESGEIFACWIFNVPETPEDNGIEIHKWQCPEGTSHTETVDWYLTNCTDTHDGVDFSVASAIGIAVLETSGGQVTFDGLPAGTAGIQEYIPDGFGPPVVFCAPENSLWAPYAAPTGHWEYDFLDDDTSEILTCHVFNIPGSDGSITIEKWTCPPGYDLYAWGADPLTDCTEATNGVQFQLGLAADGFEAELQSTGDILDGAVVFDNLEPDTYLAVEVIPDGIETVFVLECTGHIMGVLQPYPLAVGNVLEIDLDAGEHLTCFWFNVPELEGGSLTLVKYTCTTEIFVSAVDCQIEEDGVTFDLEIFNEGTTTWDVVDTRETDGFGRIDWLDLADGDYRVVEHGADWCHLEIEPAEVSPGVAQVLAGTTVEFHVYSCDGTPGDPGDTPTKYPNTGVEPIVTNPATIVPGVSTLTPGHPTDR